MAKKFMDILGAAAANAIPGTGVPVALANTGPAPGALTKSKSRDAVDAYLKYALAPGILGGVIGAVAWKKHRVLGALAGGAVGANAYVLATDKMWGREGAAVMLGTAAMGTIGSLYWKKHRAAGWVAGVAAATAAASFTSAEHHLLDYMRGRGQAA